MNITVNRETGLIAVVLPDGTLKTKFAKAAIDNANQLVVQIGEFTDLIFYFDLFPDLQLVELYELPDQESYDWYTVLDTDCKELTYTIV
jgi:hypothetical protein